FRGKNQVHAPRNSARGVARLVILGAGCGRDPWPGPCVHPSARQPRAGDPGARARLRVTWSWFWVLVLADGRFPLRRIGPNWIRAVVAGDDCGGEFTLRFARFWAIVRLFGPLALQERMEQPSP